MMITLKEVSEFKQERKEDAIKQRENRENKINNFKTSAKKQFGEVCGIIVLSLFYIVVFGLAYKFGYGV